jgi:hypothetical protein
MSNVDQVLRPDRSAGSWVSGSAPACSRLVDAELGELSELFDVLCPWRRAASWLLRERALTLTTTGSSRCAARSTDWRGVCLRAKSSHTTLSQMREVEVPPGRIAFRNYLANVAWRCR